MGGGAKIHGELQRLGFVESESTIARNLWRIQRRGDPAKSGLRFLRNHHQAIVVFAPFTLPTAMFRVLYCSLVIEPPTAICTSASRAAGYASPFPVATPIVM